MIKGKKALAILPIEIKYIIIGLIFAMGFWFINSSFKEWIVGNWDLTPMHTLSIGIGILLIGLFLVKYKPYQYFIK